MMVCPTCHCRGSSECLDRWHGRNDLAAPGQYDVPQPGSAARRAYSLECPDCKAEPGETCKTLGMCYERKEAGRGATMIDLEQVRNAFVWLARFMSPHVGLLDLECARITNNEIHKVGDDVWALTKELERRTGFLDDNRACEVRDELKACSSRIHGIAGSRR